LDQQESSISNALRIESEQIQRKMEKTLKKLVKMGINKIPSTPATMPGSGGPITGARNSDRGYSSKVSGHS
jgi:hypothetical protein